MFDSAQRYPFFPTGATPARPSARLPDRHSNAVIASAIELSPNYCTRFYDRQSTTRRQADKDILICFEELPDGYFRSDKPGRSGTPTVAFRADSLHLSPNYFGDLIRKETGRPALDYIHRKMTDTAKNMLAERGRSVSEAATPWATSIRNTSAEPLRKWRDVRRMNTGRLAGVFRSKLKPCCFLTDEVALMPGRISVILLFFVPLRSFRQESEKL